MTCNYALMFLNSYSGPENVLNGDFEGDHCIVSFQRGDLHESSKPVSAASGRWSHGIM